MKKVGINLTVALLAFFFGMLSWLLNPLGTMSQMHEPLVVTIKQNSEYNLPTYPYESSYIVTVRNTSDKTIRGFSLGSLCACKSWDSDGNLYPPNITFSNPVPDWQVLQPGETLDIPMSFVSTIAPRVWPDLVHFEDGSNWGPNRGHKEGYVRE
jgi:hypothetical protein